MLSSRSAHSTASNGSTGGGGMAGFIAASATPFMRASSLSTLSAGSSVDAFDVEADEHVLAESRKASKPKAPAWTRAGSSHNLSTAVTTPKKRSITAVVNGDASPPKWASEKLTQLLHTLREKKKQQSTQPKTRRKALFQPNQLKRLYEAKCKDRKHAPSDAGAERFAETVSKNCSNSKADLSGLGLGPRAAGVVRDELYDNTDVATLIVSNNHIAAQGAISIAELVYEHPSVTHVDVSGNYINSSGLQAVCTACAGSGIRVLDISSADVPKNALGSKGARALADLLARKDCVLEDLRLAGTSPANFSVLATRGLARNSSVTSLDLSANKIDPTALTKICLALSSSRVQQLNISHNVVHDDVIEPLCQLVDDSVTLTSLNLAHCFTVDIDDDTVHERAVRFCQVLSVALQKITCRLQTLILDGNVFGDEGVQEFAESLQVNQTLQSMSLVGCNITSAGISALSSALNRNSSLTALNLKANQLGDEGVKALLDGLLHGKGSISGLLFLNLSHNFVGDDGAQSVAELLMDNDTLQELAVEENRITDAGARTILQALNPSAAHANRSLLALHIRLNQFSHSLVAKLEKGIAYNHKHNRNITVKEFKQQVSAMKKDEEALHRTEQHLSHASSVLQGHSAKWRNAEETVQQWRQEQWAESQAMADELSELKRQVDAEMANINSELNRLTQLARVAKSKYQQKSAQLSFKIGNEKKKKYSRIEQITRTEKLLEQHQQEQSVTQQAQEDLERTLADEQKAHTNMKRYFESTTNTLKDLRVTILKEYLQGLGTFVQLQEVAHLKRKREELLRQAGPRVDTATSSFHRELIEQQLAQEQRQRRSRLRVNVTRFVQWYFQGKPTEFFDRPVKDAPRYVGFHETVNLTVRVATKPEQVQNTVLIQKSHTVQSLCMHGLHEGSTLWVTLHDPMLTHHFSNSEFYLEELTRDNDITVVGPSSAANSSSFSSSSSSSSSALSASQRSTHREEALKVQRRRHVAMFPPTVGVEVSGGMIVPRVIRIVCAKLHIQPHQVRVLSYDPTEARPKRGTMSRSTSNVSLVSVHSTHSRSSNPASPDGSLPRSPSTALERAANIFEEVRSKYVKPEQGGLIKAKSEMDVSHLQDNNAAAPSSSSNSSSDLVGAAALHAKLRRQPERRAPKRSSTISEGIGTRMRRRAGRKQGGYSGRHSLFGPSVLSVGYTPSQRIRLERASSTGGRSTSTSGGGGITNTKSKARRRRATSASAGSRAAQPAPPKKSVHDHPLIARAASSGPPRPVSAVRATRQAPAAMRRASQSRGRASSSDDAPSRQSWGPRPARRHSAVGQRKFLAGPYQRLLAVGGGGADSSSSSKPLAVKTVTPSLFSYPSPEDLKKQQRSLQNNNSVVPRGFTGGMRGSHMTAGYGSSGVRRAQAVQRVLLPRQLSYGNVHNAPNGNSSAAPTSKPPKKKHPASTRRRRSTMPAVYGVPGTAQAKSRRIGAVNPVPVATTTTTSGAAAGSIPSHVAAALVAAPPRTQHLIRQAMQSQSSNSVSALGMHSTAPFRSGSTEFIAV